MSEFERIYAISPDQALIRIVPPFSQSRLEFYRLMSPSQATEIPTGPDAMIIRWQDGKPVPWAQQFGNALNFGQIIEHTIGLFPEELEGDQTIINLRIPGDFVLNTNATEAEYLATLEEMLRTVIKIPATLAIRDVDRKVIVLRGRWSFAAFDDLSSYVVEIYPAYLKLNRQRPGGGGTGDVGRLVKWAGHIIDRQILIEAQEVPTAISWRDNRSRSSPQAHERDSNVNLVLDHIQQQTGLTWSEEARKVRRLFVECSAN